MARAQNPPTVRGIRLVVFAFGLALAAAGFGSVLSHQQNGAVETDVDSLPQQVRDGLERAARIYPEPLSGARWLRVRTTNDTNHSVYQLQGKNGRGNKIEIEMTGAGRVIEVEEHGIPVSEVPEAVREALKARMPHFEPTRVEAIYQAQQRQPVCYGFEGRDANGTNLEVYISADGKTFLN